MAIFKDNYFTNDSYNLRTSRLEILKNYIEYWAAPLAIPRALVEWGLHAHEKWLNTLLVSQDKRMKRENIYQNLADADSKTFKYYLKCKRLIKATHQDDKLLLKQFGIVDQFPRNRQAKMKKVEKLLNTYKQIIDKQEPLSIPQNFIAKLKTLYLESQNWTQKIEQLKKNDSPENESDQMELFKEDSRKLRTLLSWVLMTWEADEPYLVQLGFAVKANKSEEDTSDDEDN